MIIKAVVKLQRCRHSDRQAFVPSGQPEHGRAKGPIARYEVTGESWDHIRRILKNIDVVGHSNVRPVTVERFSQDIGRPYGRIALIQEGK